MPPATSPQQQQAWRDLAKLQDFNPRAAMGVK